MYLLKLVCLCCWRKCGQLYD